MFPAGVPHRWWNAEHNPLETNDRLVSAADLDRFLQAVFAVANAETSGSMAVLCCILMHRHRRTQRLTAIAWAVRRMAGRRPRRMAARQVSARRVALCPKSCSARSAGVKI
jgi:hypothetical protein